MFRRWQEPIWALKDLVNGRGPIETQVPCIFGIERQAFHDLQFHHRKAFGMLDNVFT